MSPKKQRIAIAKTLGWENIWSSIMLGTDPSDGLRDTVPDYLEDLNAMHEVEIFLSKQTNSDGGSRMPWYRHNLYNVCLDAKSPFCNPEHATAAQRAEAFLKTVKLWEESETPMQTYSVEEKMQGLDLYGLPCRIPEPTPAQAKCSHTEVVDVDDGYENYDEEWVSDWKQYTVCIMDDIPGTNNIRCTRCGYTRRY